LVNTCLTASALSDPEFASPAVSGATEAHRDRCTRPKFAPTVVKLGRWLHPPSNESIGLAGGMRLALAMVALRPISRIALRQRWAAELRPSLADEQCLHLLPRAQQDDVELVLTGDGQGARSVARDLHRVT